MHNGNVGCWSKVKRRLAMSVREHWFAEVKGGVDSEWGFALVLDELEGLGVKPKDMEVGGKPISHRVLGEAVLGAIRRINRLTKEAKEEEEKTAQKVKRARGPMKKQNDEDEDEPLDTRSLLNFALTDGESVICTRYISSLTDAPASLYFSSGTSWERITYPTPSPSSSSSSPPSSSIAPASATDYTMSRPTRDSSTIIVASEPLTFERGDWVTVPTNSMLTIRKQNVLIHPIIDEFYGEGGGGGGGGVVGERREGFASSKGQKEVGG